MKSRQKETSLKPVAPNEAVLVKKISPTLVTEFHEWMKHRVIVRTHLFKMVDILYGKALETDELPQKADTILKMLQAAYMAEKKLPAELGAIFIIYLKTEREAMIKEFEFWYHLNETYKLWLKPRLALRQGYAIVQLPRDAFELAENRQT